MPESTGQAQQDRLRDTVDRYREQVLRFGKIVFDAICVNMETRPERLNSPFQF